MPRDLDLVFLLLSYIALFAFGLELLGILRNWPKWSRFGWILPFAGFVGLSGIFEPSSLSSEAICRYVIGFPSALLAALALGNAAMSHRSKHGAKTWLFLCGGAIASAVYAVATGLLQPPFPSPGVIILRASCGLVLGGFLTEAFVVEIARIQNEIHLRSKISGMASSAGQLQHLIREKSNPELQLEVTESIQQNLEEALATLIAAHESHGAAKLEPPLVPDSFTATT